MKRRVNINNSLALRLVFRDYVFLFRNGGFTNVHVASWELAMKRRTKPKKGFVAPFFLNFRCPRTGVVEVEGAKLCSLSFRKWIISLYFSSICIRVHIPRDMRSNTDLLPRAEEEAISIHDWLLLVTKTANKVLVSSFEFEVTSRMLISLFFFDRCNWQ